MDNVQTITIEGTRGSSPPAPTIEQGTENTLINFVVQTTSIKPSINECERFIKFLNVRFNLGIQDNLIINIHQTTPSRKGYYMPSLHSNHYENEQNNKALNFICISSIYLKETPYETIAHELAHYLHDFIDNKPCKNNYHNKHFKKRAEQLLLKVSKGKHGFDNTEQTDAFIELLQDFKPDDNAFKIFQHANEIKKQKSRNLLYMCSCGVKIRTAKNENKPLNAICQWCDSKFIQQGGEND
jgi:predicted SprT family Zn-dependent metalloprotease